MSRKPWDIFGKTPIPSLPGGDSNKDAGVYIDKLTEEGHELMALLEVHCNLCLVHKLMFGTEAQARKACTYTNCKTYQWTKGPRTKDIVAEMFERTYELAKPPVNPIDTPIRDMMGHTTRSYLMLQFESRLGNADEARLLMDVIYRYASHTQYHAFDLAEKARQLLDFGIKPEDILDTLKKIVKRR